MNAHLGDDAELYPLGLLDDEAARAVEYHIADCVECAERVMNAQATAASFAASLSAALPSSALAGRVARIARPKSKMRARPSFALLALAAGLTLALLTLGWQTLAFRGRLASDDLALATLVHGHFNHVTMTAESAAPVAAKVLYARDGSWLYVIVDEPRGTLRAVGRTRAGSIDLGFLTSAGRTATLLVRPALPIDVVTLQRGGTVVASAVLTR